MKLCTVTRITGLDQKEHFAITRVGQAGWPVAIGGLTSGALAKKSEEEIRILAEAPAMLDMLAALVFEFSNINPKFEIAPGKAAFLVELVERANRLVGKHKGGG